MNDWKPENEDHQLHSCRKLLSRLLYVSFNGGHVAAWMQSPLGPRLRSKHDPLHDSDFETLHHVQGSTNNSHCRSDALILTSQSSGLVSHFKHVPSTLLNSCALTVFRSDRLFRLQTRVCDHVLCFLFFFYYLYLANSTFSDPLSLLSIF
jgi:hypothetical protein